ncbi:hypothetical protein [Tateyamaria sp.]|uniref:hypothetical protein n=1 Tax=Tateyamaria sp. TaxID=1929288 RepID=UPI00329D6C52
MTGPITAAKVRTVSEFISNTPAKPFMLSQIRNPLAELQKPSEARVAKFTEDNTVDLKEITMKTGILILLAITVAGCTEINQAVDMTQDYELKKMEDYTQLRVDEKSYLTAFHPADQRMIIMGSAADKAEAGFTLGASGTDVLNERKMFNAASTILGQQGCNAIQIFDAVAGETFEVTYTCPNGRLVSRSDF